MFSGSRFDIRLIWLLMLISTPFASVGQKVADVHAKYTYVVDDNDNITIREAKIRCIEHARAEAIKNQFGTLVTSDVMSADKVTDKESSSFFMMDIATSSKGEWLGDEKDPVVTVESDGTNILFTAEVWGKAREIVRASTDIRWQVMKMVEGQMTETENFDSGERVFVKFSTPADGYVAVYLITADNETSCLLPYKKDPQGRFQVKRGREYTFFDKSEDMNASYYKLGTSQLLEYDQLVVIYSPNPFTKCNDISVNSRKPNTLDQKDFAKWLLKQQRADKDMVVSRKWVAIHGKE